VDSQLKACNKPQILKSVLGGMFVDEKIVQKGCKHRYTRDESFNAVCIEVTLSQRLEDGLEKYVQGEVLDEYRVSCDCL
jgi:ubiquitin carboxyl-terminal hydrolase 9/24